MKSIKNYITKQYLSNLNTMNISINSIIDNFYTGARKSNKNGISLEFSDFKEYTPGDDIRRIDWNNYAHNDKIYIKRFKEEKQAIVNIFLDASKSMDYGNENKGYYSKIMAATIAYISLKNLDSVNIFVCNDKLIKKQINNKNLFADTINFLDNIQYSGETDLIRSISALGKINKGISFILSDFLLQNRYKDAIKALQYKKQEIFIMHILSPQELLPQQSGNIKLVDSETLESKEITIDDNILQKYLIVLKDFQNEIKDFCLNIGANYKLISTNSILIGEFRNFAKK